MGKTVIALEPVNHLAMLRKPLPRDEARPLHNGCAGLCLDVALEISNSVVYSRHAFPRACAGARFVRAAGILVFTVTLRRSIGRAGSPRRSPRVAADGAADAQNRDRR